MIIRRNSYPTRRSPSPNRLRGFDPRLVDGLTLWFDPGDANARVLTTATIADGTDLSQGSWSKGAIASVSPNDDGVGDKVTTTSGSGTNNWVSQTLGNASQNATACPTYYFVFELKAGTATWVEVDTCSGTGRTIWLDLATGTQGTTPSGISNVVISAEDGDGYRRYSLELNSTSGAPEFTIRAVGGDGVTTNPGNGILFYVKSVAVSQPRVASLLNKATGIWWAQGTANNQPGFEPAGLGGLATIRSYSSQFLESTEPKVVQTFSGLNRPWTIMGSVIPRHNVATQSNSVFSAFSGSTDNLTVIYQDNGGIGPWAIRRVDSLGVLTDNQSAIHGGANVPHVVEAWFTGIKVSITLDGKAPSPNGATNDRATISPTTARLFSFGTGGSSRTAMGTFLVYNRALTPSERQYLRRGLGQSRGIVVG